MNCLIVDDEYMARLLLEEYVKKVPFLTLVGTCENALEAFHLLKTEVVDVIFLDIQMPHLTGLEFAKILQNKPAIVFTTAYSEHAVEGFQLDVVDYLLKPFSFERFVQAASKASNFVAFHKKAPLPLPTESSLPGYFFVKSDGKQIKIRFDDILYIEGLKEYVSIYTTDKQRVVTLQSIKNLEAFLPKNTFLRIHKSYIISLAHIEALVGNQVEIHNKLLPIGATYKEEVMKSLQLE